MRLMELKFKQLESSILCIVLFNLIWYYAITYNRNYWKYLKNKLKKEKTEVVLVALTT